MAYLTRNQINIQPILEAYGHKELSDVLISSREAQYSECRNVIMYYLKSNGWTLREIGGFIGKHYTTIINGCRRTQDLLESDKKFRSALMEVIIQCELK